eukprot:20864-Heterococcus_DN1.PRE.2
MRAGSISKTHKATHKAYSIVVRLSTALYATLLYRYLRRNKCTHTFDSTCQTHYARQPFQLLYLCVNCSVLLVQNCPTLVHRAPPQNERYPSTSALQELHEHTAFVSLSFTLPAAAAVLASAFPCRKFSTTLLCVGRAISYLKYCWQPPCCLLARHNT